MQHRHYDALVIGAGFYGCNIALHLRKLGLRKVLLVEKERGILTRASLINQARIHNGYHYPRSLQTAISSRKYYMRFKREYDYALAQGMRKIYAIAKNSRVTANQFERFCRQIGAPLSSASASATQLFDRSLIEEVFWADEIAFNASAIRESLLHDIHESGIDLLTQSEARFDADFADSVSFTINGKKHRFSLALNCTYANLDEIGIDIKTKLRKEWAEIALITPPPEISRFGITVMDGPFFSTMPYPAASCYSLSHVRYTPISAWQSSRDSQGETSLKHGYSPRSINATPMIRDASRYLPSIAKARLKGSIFDVKVVLVQNEDNDGRPILLESSKVSERVISCLGGKIDNIYDILSKLSEPNFLTTITAA